MGYRNPQSYEYWKCLEQSNSHGQRPEVESPSVQQHRRLLAQVHALSMSNSVGDETSYSISTQDRSQPIDPNEDDLTISDRTVRHLSQSSQLPWSGTPRSIPADVPDQSIRQRAELPGSTSAHVRNYNTQILAPIRQPTLPSVLERYGISDRPLPATPPRSIWGAAENFSSGINTSRLGSSTPFTHFGSPSTVATSIGTSSPIGTPFHHSDVQTRLYQHKLEDRLRLHELDSSSIAQRPSVLNSPPITPESRFRPMAALAPSEIAQGIRAGNEIAPPQACTFSNNYRGEHSVRNASVDDLSPDKNCALWLTNLPPNVTYQQLLREIRKVGRIWCTVINDPDYTRHTTAAAKVVFFTPGPAQRLLARSLTQGIYVGGHKVRVTHNRVKYKEEVMGNVSRVLIITGKSENVNTEFLTAWFRTRFVFDIDEVIELLSTKDKPDMQDRTVLEYRFASYRCQAQMGKMSLEKDRPEWLEKVEFGPDPSEHGENLESYAIAAERIRGLGI